MKVVSTSEAAGKAHRQARAGAGIAEIERGLPARSARRCRCRGSRQRPGRLARRSSRPAPVMRRAGAQARPRLRAGLSMRVSPMASSPKIMERCEIDLSPGTRSAPREAVFRGLLETGDARE